MKIVVEGQIIDTENIYRISDEVLEGDNVYYFDIVSFNEMTLEVSVKKYQNNKISDEFEIQRLSYLEIKETNISDEEKRLCWKKAEEIHNQIPIENKNSLEKMRQDIVKIWSENQSVIPKFKVENYL
jgi:hypothetical protein